MSKKTVNEAPERQRLLRELRGLKPDFKAAVVAAEVSATALSADDIYFRNQSTFKRPVSKDIAAVSWAETDAGETHLLFDLNREGIYDMLPEATVHRQVSDKKKGEESHTKRGTALRNEERAARRFFSPIENEFAQRSLRLEILEREILHNRNPARNRQFFEYFFGDSRQLTDKQVLTLSHILPLCHKIRGNTDLIGLTLSKVLGYRVSVESTLTMQTHTASAPLPRLGSGTLGVDVILNEEYVIAAPHYIISIWNVGARDYHEFLGKGRNANVIQFIADYLFPSTTQVSIRLHSREEERGVVLAEGDSHTFLGFNSYL